MRFLQFVVHRILLTIPVLFVVASIVFVVMRVLPADPAIVILGNNATAEALANLRERLGLNEPLWNQYLTFLWHLLHGNLGHSLLSNQSVTAQILFALPYSVELTLGSLLISVIIGIPLGIFTAVHKNTFLDYTGRVVALSGISIPVFYLGILLLLFFSLYLNWFPTISRGEVGSIGDRLYHLALPALTLGLVEAAFVTRMTRSSLLDVMGEEYMRTAYAKGLREQLVIYKHGLRNALIPIVTAIGLDIGTVLGGAILTETVFNRPGVGKLLIGAILQRDYPVIQGGIIVFASFVAIINLMVDVLYGVIDPRVRYG